MLAAFAQPGQADDLAELRAWEPKIRAAMHRFAVLVFRDQKITVE